MNKTITIVALVILGACSPRIRVDYDYDPDYNAWTFQTFDWGQKFNIESGQNPLHYNALNDQRIKSAVKHELTSRGYTFTEYHPDLIIHYHIVVDDQSIITLEPYDHKYGPYWMRVHTNIYSYSEGTLIIDLVDSKTDSLVWRGWATSAIQVSYSPEEIDRLIKKAVRQIFKKFEKEPGYLREQRPLVFN
jgi:hypothetical protein